MEKAGRNGQPRSVSVDRCCLLHSVKETLHEKASTLEKPEKNRSKWGFACALMGDLRRIRTREGQQAFDVFEDPILNGRHPQWDHAHAKLVRAQPCLKRA